MKKYLPSAALPQRTARHDTAWQAATTKNAVSALKP